MSLSASASSAFRLIGGLVVFVIVLIAAYYAARLMSNRQGGFLRGKNLDVTESRAVGAGATVSIVRAGGKFFLVGATKERVNLIAELNADEMEEASVSTPMPGGFQAVFKRFLGKNEDAVNEGERE